MQFTRLAVIALRIVLVVAFLLLVLFQVLSFPGQFAHMAQENPDRASLRWPLTIFSILEVACVQVVIVSTWKLLTMVERDSIFSHEALRWVDAIVWAIAAAWTMLAVLSATVVLSADDPGLPLRCSCCWSPAPPWALWSWFSARSSGRQPTCALIWQR